MQWRVTRGNFTGKQINLKYTERILRDRLPAIIQEQSADNLCTFQHDGAPCHKTWSEVCRNLETLDSWAGKFPCRNLTQNLWSVVGRGEADKATNRLKRWSGKNGSNKSWQWTKCGDWTGSYTAHSKGFIQRVSLTRAPFLTFTLPWMHLRALWGSVPFRGILWHADYQPSR